MNVATQITIDAEPEPGTAIAVIPPHRIPTLLAADDKDILANLRKELAGYVPDASTEAGRTEIGKKVRRIGTAKMDFKRLKDALLENAKKQVSAVNAEYKVIETNCDALRDAIDGVLEAYKQIERDRIAGHERALAELASFGVIPDGWPSGHIATRIDELEDNELRTRDWQEFAGRARDTIEAAVNALRAEHRAAVTREAEAAELAKLRAEQAERDRLAAIEAQRVREEQIAQAAAERAKQDAEAKAARDAADAERRAQAERDAAARREREAKQAQERAEAAALKAEADRVAAEERAERDRVAAEARAVRERDAAIEAERARAAKERADAEAAARKRAENVAHQKKINGEVLADLLKAIEPRKGLVSGGADAPAEEIARTIVVAIAKGQIRNVVLKY